MLQSMGLQRVGHNLVTQQPQLETKKSAVGPGRNGHAC